MKKITLFLVCYFSIFIACGKKPSGSEHYKIIFYNTENLFDAVNDPKTQDEEFTPTGTNKYTDSIYRIHLAHTAKVLGAILETEQPLFIGLCEIENQQVLADLIKTAPLNQYSLGIVHQESPDARGIDVGLLYNKKLFSLEKQEFLKVSMVSDTGFKTRDILHATGTLSNGEMMDVFVNHWPSRREGQVESEPRRLAAASVLKAASDKVLAANANANIIMMGDFNDYPTDKSIATVLGAQPIQNKILSDTLYNLMQKPASGPIQGTHFFKGEWGFLDQMIISRGLVDNKKTEIVDKRADVFYRDFMIYTNRDGVQSPNKFYAGSKFVGGYSDHFPICATITFDK